MDKDPSSTPCATGCAVGCVVLILLVNSIGMGSSSELTLVFIIFVSIATGLIAFHITEKVKREESDRENQEVAQLVKSAAVGFKESLKSVDQSIELMCRATYYGGHKKYEDIVDVSFVVTKDRILIKELPGHAV
ncbi:hypothetical protein [Desulfonatronovibrio magnus]|uniref:hypothetical protein n=1 Tax=Desulfonatronovibrio magnus TaxID=698827 RepID=UPI0012FC93B9|nr:hypothetical protein [Desulfonatronovibrio magnus]